MYSGLSGLLGFGGRLRIVLLVGRIMARLVVGIGLLIIRLWLRVSFRGSTARVAGIVLGLLGAFPLILGRGAVIVAVVLLRLVVVTRTPRVPRPPNISRPIGKV